MPCIPEQIVEFLLSHGHLFIEVTDFLIDQLPTIEHDLPRHLSISSLVFLGCLSTFYREVRVFTQEMTAFIAGAQETTHSHPNGAEGCCVVEFANPVIHIRLAVS